MTFSLKVKKWIACSLAIVLCAGTIWTLLTTTFSKGVSAIDPAFDIVEGCILSSDGTVLCTCGEDENRGTVTDPQIFGTLLGMNDRSHGRSGLRRRYKDILYADNGKRICKGNDMTLTLNHSVQTFAYEVMLPFSKSGHTNASAVVIENETGRVIALISIKTPLRTKDGKAITYDVNDVPAFYTELEDSGVKLPDGYFLNEWANPQTPGSVFKVISSIPILERGLQKEQESDQGVTILKNNLRIENAGDQAFGSIDLRDALIHSSNVYFSTIYDKYMASADLKQMLDRALLGGTLELDFADLSSSFDVSTHSKYIMSTFGQITAVSPVHMAALLSGICSGTGEVKKPYMVEKVVSPKGKTVSETTQSVLTELADPKTVRTLCDDLRAVAESYGFKNVYMKTGTAELGNGECQYYCFCANEAYTVLVSTRNLEKSTLLCTPSYEILRYATSTILDQEDADDAYAKSAEDSLHSLLGRVREWFRNDKQAETPEMPETPENESAEQNENFFRLMVRFFKA